MSAVHPNLLLNADELTGIRAKIDRYPWAAALFARATALADDAVAQRDLEGIREIALCYALTGEVKYGDAARTLLLARAREMMPWLATVETAEDRDNLVWTPMGVYAYGYDLAYAAFTPAEREEVEAWLRLAGQKIIAVERIATTSRNLVFNKHIAVGLIGFCLGDAELIAWGLHDPGTASPPFFVTWGGGGLTQVLDTFIRDGYFWGETPIYALHYVLWGMLALAEAARHYDGADYYRHVSAETGASVKSLIDGYLRMGYPLEATGIGGGSVRMATYGDGSTNYGVQGVLNDTWLIEGANRTTRDGGIFPGILEIAYARYGDPGYAWLLARNPLRDARVVYGGSPWGFVGLTHGVPLPDDPTPPPAPSGVYPGQGFALLRADDSPAYWTSGALAAVVTLGTYIGHGHFDHYSLILHGKGRLLYPDVNVIQYEKDHLGWTRDGIGHSTLLVDGQSPVAGPYDTRQAFDAEAKFFAHTGSAFPGVTQTRALLLTRDYLVDLFHAADDAGAERTFDWVLHGLGRFYPGNPGAYRPTDALLPYYWSVGNERGRDVDATWQVDWIQRSAGVRAGLQFGPAWFATEVGVRMAMLGTPGTAVHYGDGGLVNGPPHFRIEGDPEGAAPLVVVRRRAAETIFAAVHEAYTGQPRLRGIRRLAEAPGALALEIAGDDFTDTVLLAVDGEEHTLALPDGRTVTFRDYHYTRAPRVEVEITPEQAAWLHAWCLPEAVHLSATQETPHEVVLHLRCVGQGSVAGRLRVMGPDTLVVTPPLLDITPLAEGEERVVALTVRPAPDAPSGLYNLTLVPEAGLHAAPCTLPVSVGVVITLERRVPHDKQTLVRAPGYALQLDHATGLPGWLLDADGRRRYAAGTFRTSLFTLTRLDDGQALGPCDSVWLDDHRFTCLTNPRLSLIVEEDTFVFALAHPSDPNVTWVLALSNLLDLQPPVTRQMADADLFFYPPAYHRLGLLVRAPRRPADYTGDGFPLRVGEPVTFRFGTEVDFHAWGG